MIAFTSVKKPYGWMGNTAPYPVSYGGDEFRTTGKVRGVNGNING